MTKSDQSPNADYTQKPASWAIPGSNVDEKFNLNVKVKEIAI